MKKNSNKNIIWSNCNLNLDDWMDGIKENLDLNEVDYSNWDLDKFYHEMFELNASYLDDERANLNIPTEGRIILIANVGLWNGRRMGYKLLNDHNINACLEFERDCVFAEWKVDSHNNLCSHQIHHDNSHEILYREVKPEITSDQLDYFCWKVYRGIATSRDISKYTRSLGKQIKAVYGW